MSRKAENDRLIKLFAIKIAAQDERAPIKSQQKAHDKFFAYWESLVKKYPTYNLNSDEFWRTLESKARIWWSKQAFRGPAAHW